MSLTVYTSGEVLTAASLNDNFNYAVTVPAAPERAIFNQTQASGTQGGTYTALAWQKLVLNTTDSNTITGCSVASSVITLTAGTYLVEASNPFVYTGASGLRLRNTTASTTTLRANGPYFVAGTNGSGIISMTGSFTIAGSTNFEYQAYGESTRSGYGLGVALTTGESEVYGFIQITRTA